jgi:hypothetical protein
VIAPRRSAIILYLALLILVVAAIVILLRQSEKLEESTDPDAAYYSRHEIPLRDPPPSAYDIPPDYVSSSARDSSRFGFTPYTVTPRCPAGCGTDDLLRHLPADRRTRLACHGAIGIHIDTNGRVMETQILRGGGNPVCDRAVRAWAQTTRWTTAYNIDQPVVVWIARPFDFADSE